MSNVEGTENPHPWDQAKSVFDRAMADGETWDNSAGLALNSLANAAQRGDQRAIVQKAHQVPAREADLQTRLQEAGVELTPEVLAAIAADEG